MNSRFARGVVVLAVVIGLVGAGCRKGRRGSPSDGGVMGGQYTNRFFGFALPIPDGWSIASQEVLNATANVGKESFAESGDKRIKAALKASEKKTSYLLLISEHPLGAAVPFNGNIVVVAESVRHAPGVKTGGDFLYHLRTLLKASNAGYKSRGEPKETQLGTRTFYREQYSAAAPGTAGVTFEQAYYVEVRDGYALTFIVSAGGKAELPRVEATLKDLHFR